MGFNSGFKGLILDENNLENLIVMNNVFPGHLARPLNGFLWVSS